MCKWATETQRENVPTIQNFFVLQLEMLQLLEDVQTFT